MCSQQHDRDYVHTKMGTNVFQIQSVHLLPDILHPLFEVSSSPDPSSFCSFIHSYLVSSPYFRALIYKYFPPNPSVRLSSIPLDLPLSPLTSLQLLLKCKNDQNYIFRIRETSFLSSSFNPKGNVHHLNNSTATFRPSSNF